MKKLVLISSLFITILSCSDSSNFTVTGTVKGLKKGTLYLQSLQDTSLVNVDSMVVDGNPDFTFKMDLKEPEVLYLYLDKADASGYDDRLPFFAEAGEMSITTTLKNFEGTATIIGSQNQLFWKEYQNMNQQFNDKNLDLLKGSFEARRDGKQESIKAYDDSIQSLIKRKYLYTGNFANVHKNSEIAPYLLLTQIPDASTSYLDTLYNRFPKNIKQSKYGKELKNIVESALNQ